MIENGLFSEAERSLEGLKDAVNGDSQVLQGLLLLKRGEYAGAETVLYEVTQKRPNDPAVLNLLGAALHEQARFDEAGYMFDLAHGMDPSSERLAANLGHARAAAAAERLRSAAQPVVAAPQ